MVYKRIDGPTYQTCDYRHAKIKCVYVYDTQMGCLHLMFASCVSHLWKRLQLLINAFVYVHAVKT